MIAFTESVVPTKQQNTRRIIRTLLENGPLDHRTLVDRVIDEAAKEHLQGVGPHSISQAIIVLVGDHILDTNGPELSLRRAGATQ